MSKYFARFALAFLVPAVAVAAPKFTIIVDGTGALPNTFPARRRAS